MAVRPSQYIQLMDYDEAIDWLYGTQLFGIKLGLEGTVRLFDKLDLFDALQGRKVFHVAGTNGKGSTCAMIDSICRAAGKTCGLFTSPHLICFRERIRVDGSMIPENEVARILTQVRDEVSQWETHPTFFEITTALAVSYFCQQDVEVLVIETGMGGRLDASNVLPTTISVITSVDLDHQEWLGDTVEAIALEKAGIIKPGVPVVISSNQSTAVLCVFERVADEQNAPLHRVKTPDHNDAQEIKLKGFHQRLNAELAIKAVSTLWPDLSAPIITHGLNNLSWPGRFDRRPGNMVIDGAHNPAAMRALVSTWKEEFSDVTLAAVVFSATDSKEVGSILTELSTIAELFIFVEISANRGLKVAELTSSLLESQARDIPFFESSDLADALKQATESGLPILVTGSLFLAGEALAHCERAHSRFESSEQ
ncbi:MAG: bifunctional folylpolyglutamate synthase/dihydrofolate synthase [Verrucomicrobia bacterium]|nr:bifunctional folylpolyglutamate synthase/dihydrofolate synthase [Verrucomicrobiota bacterium]